MDRLGYSQRQIDDLTARFQIKPMGDEPLAVDHAQGLRVWDADGKEYLDAISGEWVVNLGFRNPEIADAAIEQLGARRVDGAAVQLAAARAARPEGRRNRSGRTAQSALRALGLRCGGGCDAHGDALDRPRRIRLAVPGLPRPHVRDDRALLHPPRHVRGGQARALAVPAPPGAGCPTSTATAVPSGWSIHPASCSARASSSR